MHLVEVSNQTMTITFEWRIKSWMNCWKRLDAFEVNSHLLNGIKSHAQDGYAKEKIKIDMLTPSLVDD